MTLEWKEKEFGIEATLGDFEGEGGARFSLVHYPTCYRRGPWRLLVEVVDRTHEWGCFDEQDAPMRWFHSKTRALEEAQAIADVLVRDHDRKEAHR